MQRTKIRLWVGLAALVLMSLACVRTAPPSRTWKSAAGTPIMPIPFDATATDAQSAPLPAAQSARPPGAPIQTPTPDAPRPLPTLRTDVETYVIQPGDSLGRIAQRYGVTLQALIDENGILNADLVEPGQRLTIPAGVARTPGPEFKIIPDSELVYGPAAADFDTLAYVSSAGGYLNRYVETLDSGETLTGAQVIERIAQEFSVNPRLLLAVLEHRSGWVTRVTPPEGSKDYPLRYADVWRKGLYKQMAWAANNLNRGYYLWRAGGVPSWVLKDGAIIPAAATLNAGTAGVQQFFSLLMDAPEWTQTVTAGGFQATYQQMFGYPFDYAVEPLLPNPLIQPDLVLPFERGVDWYFTGGPHGGWAEGSAWAAIDFAPPGEALGCVPSDAWVTASADGRIVRSGGGAVVQELDDDGIEQTGWVILYMHMATQGRVAEGTLVSAGDRIGHPSCEGGFSTGTHLHLARRYNGEWIAADADLPFNLQGWLSSGDGIEYNGYLRNNDRMIEAEEGRFASNEIKR